MDELLLITDDLRRGGRLARDLGAFRACRLHDLYADAPPEGAASLVVGDVASLNSDAVLRLQQLLARVRPDGVPFLFLTHGNAARAEAQARVLGASDTLPAGAVLRSLVAALDGLRRDAPAPDADRQAGAARRFLAEVFTPDRPLTPSLVETGTGLVAHAVRDVGVRGWIQAVRRFDDALHQHCLLVAGLAAAFAGDLGMNEADRRRLTKAALLHDVGKIHVPAAILHKPGRLTAAEMAVMRTHPTLGYAMLRDGGFADEMLAVVRWHHEMLDGSGYPDGLAGARIPDLVRLITICDVYAALIERRAYKAPIPGARAYGLLIQMEGRLDGALVRAFRGVAAAFDPSDPEGRPSPSPPTVN